MDRREMLTVGASLAVPTLLAGCSGVEQNESESPSDDTESPAGDNEPATVDDDSELDLREANVVSVAIDDTGSATDFAVELHHDDAGEEGYADWWQVETLDRTQLGRRDLTHPHENNQPFERSKTIETPDDVTCVVVRGHDQTHGYGGRVVVVNLDSGAINAISQGSERQTLNETDCPS